jgi:carbon monoxide dehydrogenase subunit G
MDIRGIAPCMPGAQLTEVIDDKNYKGNIWVRLGPVALTFAGVVTFEEIDDANYSARVRAQGTDAKGRGSAQAKATFKLEPSAVGSKVLVHTDLTLSGSVAQYGRGVGMIQATATAIMNQFANALKAKIGQRQPATTAAPPASTAPVSQPAAAPPQQPAAPLPQAAKPISGFSLMASVLWNSIKRLFTGRSPG